MPTDWLKNAKRHDMVIVRGLGISRDQSVITAIDRVTATRVVLRDGTTFRKSDGHKLGADSWTHIWIEEGTVEALTIAKNEQRRAVLARQLGHRNWAKMPLEKLEAINELLSPLSNTEESK